MQIASLYELPRFRHRNILLEMIVHKKDIYGKLLSGMAT